MTRAAVMIPLACFLAVGSAAALGKGGGGGPAGIGGGPPGIGAPHGMGPGLPSPASPPGLPSPSRLPGPPDVSPPGLPHAFPALPSQGKVHSAKSKASGLNRAMSRMSPQGARNTNNPRSPNRAHGRARAEDRHALLDRPGRR